MNRVRIRRGLPWCLNPFARMFLTPDQLPNLIFSRTAQQHAPLASRIVQSLLGQGDVPEMVTNQLQPKRIEGICYVLQITLVHPGPINELHTTTTAPSSRTACQQLLCHPKTMKTALAIST